MILHTLGHALINSPHVGIQRILEFRGVVHEIRLAAADSEGTPLNQEHLKKIFSFKSLSYDKLPSLTQN